MQDFVKLKEITFQKFGYIVILNLDLKVEGFTENIRSLIPNYNPSIGQSFESLFAPIFKTSLDKARTLLINIVQDREPRTLFTKKVDDSFYYFSICKKNKYIYIEWEPQIKRNFSTSHLNDVAFLFEKDRPTNWTFVCKAINKILHYDRVIILQVQENGYSKVISENLAQKVPSMEKMEFANDFMPKEAFQYYERSAYSYLSDIDASPQEFLSESDLSPYDSVLAFPPKLHLMYFSSIGVKSAIFFPLFLNGDLWGLIIGHHHHQKNVDLHNRKLCSFIAQAAMSKYENQVKQGFLDVNQQVREFQNDLLKKLAYHKSFNCAIVESIENLCFMMQSDGIAIYDEGDVYTYGLVPDNEQFYRLISYLQKNTDKTIFKDHNFKLNHQKHFEVKLPFAGLLAYNVATNKDYYIVWFRPESLSQVTQIKITTTKTHSKIDRIEKTIHGSAIPWNDYNLNLLEGLKDLFNESILYRSKEGKKMNKELVEMNNELEMLNYTLSHDLKNPLSVLKMGLKYLQDPCTVLLPEKRQKWYKNLFQSILHIEDIIENTIQVSSYKTKQIAKDPIPMTYLLRKITEESLLANNAGHCKVTFGKLLPIWGEKSTVYQIFLNIISNAIKYSKDKDIPTIHIKSDMEDDRVCYSISDNGIGIPEDIISRIFDMFVRAENAYGYPGTGIGLALVKRIIDRMEGQIVVISTEGIGTTIRMYFPVTDTFPKALVN